MTFVVEADDDKARRIEANLYKMVNVISVEDITKKPSVSRDLALIKVNVGPDKRAEVLQLCEVFRARAVDVGPNNLIVEITGTQDKIVGLIAIAPGTIIETFVAPSIGHEAMTELESGGMGVVNGICGLAFIGGTVALGWAVHRARLRPRWVGPSLMVAAVVLVAVMTATGPAAGAAIIAATAVYGLALAALGVKG